MGFLRRAFGGGDRPATMTITTLDGHRPEAKVDIVGEASYQDGLMRFAGGLGTDGVRFPAHEALLIPEPNNRHDHNAIAIYLHSPAGEAHKVGYLPRENAVAYGPALAMLGPRTLAVNARLTGGWDRGGDNRGYIGCQLQLPTPGEIAADLFIGDRELWLGHPWVGRTVCFTGASQFRAGAVRLDKEGQEYIARRAGCDTWARVTKKVHVCVPADANDLTGNLAKAEEYGIETVPEPDFWAGIGIPLERW